MSPTLQLAGPSTLYTPLSDVLERHEYGITKNRKPASTGGGRAWSEDEVCSWPWRSTKEVRALELMSSFHRKRISCRPVCRRCHISISPLT
jgi:hypothetical protein